MAEYRPQVGQIGSQLDTSFFLFDDCISNRDKVPVEEYERMIDTDETIEMGILFLTMSILMKLGAYEHPDPKIAQFVNANFEEMQGNLYTACEEILTALWAGYSGTEIVWQPVGDKLCIQRLVTFHPRTVLIRVDRETGQYKGIKQWRWFAGSPVDIPPEKSILYTYRKKFGDYHGRSILKPGRKNWLLKDPILKMMAKALDKFGTPFTSAIVPDEDIRDPDNPDTEISQLQYAVRLLSNLQAGTGIALRYGQDNQEPKINVHGNAGAGIGDAFEKALSYLNKMIMRAILAPSLLMDEGKSGSYALGQSHFVIYNIMTSGIFRGLNETLIEQLVRRLIEYNFGKQDNYGKFAEKNLVDEDLNLLSQAFKNLTESGYLSTEVQADFDAVRSRMNMPQRNVIPKEERLKMKARTEYANYTRGGDIGDPLAGDGKNE